MIDCRNTPTSKWFMDPGHVPSFIQIHKYSEETKAIYKMVEEVLGRQWSTSYEKDTVTFMKWNGKGYDEETITVPAEKLRCICCES